MRSDFIRVLAVIVIIACGLAIVPAISRSVAFDCGEAKVAKVVDCNMFGICTAQMDDGREHVMFKPQEGQACK